MRICRLAKARLTWGGFFLFMACIPSWASPHMGVSVSSYALKDESASMDLLFTLGINESLAEALEGGIEIEYLAEMHVMEKGWFVNKVRRRFLWSAALRQRRYGQGYEYQTFDSDTWVASPTMENAFADMAEINVTFSDQQLIEQFHKNPNMFFAKRVEVKIDELPNPLQINLLTSTSWNFSSGWQTFVP